MNIYQIIRNQKKSLLAFLFVRRLDYFCRKFFSYLFLIIISVECLIYKLAPYPKKINRAHILFIGGIGDFISMSKIIDLLGVKGIDVVAYVPDASLLFTKSLFPNISVKSYNFKNFLAVSRNIVPTTHCCFIYTNPTIESHIFKFISGIRFSAGYIVDYLRLDSNLYHTQYRKKDNGLYARENELKLYLDEIFFQPPAINKLTKEIDSVPVLTKRNIILVNFFKSSLWSGAGNISEDIQTYLLDKISINFPYHDIYYVGTADLFEQAQKIIFKCSVSNRLYNFCGKTSPHELVELVNRARFVLTIDGGLLHLASHLNTNIYALTNFSDRSFFLPQKTTSIQSTTKCSPCLKPKGEPIDNYPVICNFRYRCSHDYDKTSLDEFIQKIKTKERPFLES